MAVNAQDIQFSNPFSDDVTINNYFEDAQRTELTQKIAHLLEFGSDILFLHNTKASGKTTLIKHLIQQKKEQWRTCYTDAQEANSVNSLLAILAKYFQIQEKEPQNILGKLADHLTEIHDQGLSSVLVIDDAEKLDRTILQLITSISTIAISGQPVLRIVLVGKQTPDALLKLIQQSTRPQELIELEIPVLNEEQTALYIQQRLYASNLDEQHRFDGVSIERIYQQAQGQPSHINALAFSRITSISPAQHRTSQPVRAEKDTQHQALKYIALALAIAVVVSLFLFNTKQDIEQEAREKLALEIPEPQLPDTPEQAPPAIIPEPKPAAVVEKPPVAKSPVEKTAQQVLAKEKVITPATQEAVSTTTSWLSQRNPKHFTLQLIALSSEQGARKFLDSHALSDRGSWFRTQRDGKTLYAVIYGDYASQSEAQSAATVLTERLPINKAWVRTFSGIQKSAE